MPTPDPSSTDAPPDDRRGPGLPELRADGRRLLTLPEVALHLNTTVDVVRKLIACQVLVHIKLSARNTRVPERAVVAFLDRL